MVPAISCLAFCALLSQWSMAGSPWTQAVDQLLSLAASGAWRTRSPYGDVAEELSLARKATFEDVTLASSGVAPPLLISYSRELQKELDLNQLDIPRRRTGRR